MDFVLKLGETWLQSNAWRKIVSDFFIRFKLLKLLIRQRVWEDAG